MNQIKSPSSVADVKQALEAVYSPRHERGSTRLALSRLSWGLALAAPFLASLATAADVPAASPAPALATLTKPDWLMDLSIGVKESYDDNVFLAGAKSSTTGYSSAAALSHVPSSIALATKDKASFLTSVSPKIGINFAPLLGDAKTL